MPRDGRRPGYTVQQIEKNLTEKKELMQRWGGYSPDQSDNDRLSRFCLDYRAYERAIGQAIRAGLVAHPLVVEWITGRRSIGDREGLRKFRSHLETGIKPIDEADCWIASTTAKLTEHRYDMSVEAIRSALLSKARHCPAGLRRAVEKRLQSKQNLHKKLVSLGVWNFR